MSRQAIAAVLARTDLASGERLVALSLASFAGRENRAWPGAPAASARAGLSRSRYQQAREQLGRARPGGCRRARHRPWSSEHGHPPVRRHRSVVGRRHQRRALRGGAGLQPGPRTRAAPAGDDGRGRGRGRRRARPLDRRSCALAAGIADRTYRRARTALLASGSSRAGQRRRRPREHERVDGARSARARRRCPQPRPTARGAAGGRASTHRVGRLARRCGSGSGTGDRGRRKGRPGSDTYRWKQSDPDRGFRDKGRSRSDSSGREVSSRDRGFGSKGRSGSDTFRAGSDRKPGTNPGENPGRNPGTQRARGKGTPEPQNQGRPPQPP